MPSCLLLIGVLFGLGQNRPEPTPTLTTIPQIKVHTAQGNNLNVRIQGQVTFFDFSSRLMYVQEANAGIAVTMPEGFIEVKIGDRVEIHGHRRDVPFVEARQITVLSHGAPPVPIPLRGNQFCQQEWDCRYVKLFAVIRSLIVEGSKKILYVESDSRIFRVFIAEPNTQSDLLNGILDAEVSITGVGGSYRRGDTTENKLLIQRPDAIQILKPGPAKPFQLPITSIATLPRFTPHLVRVQGFARQPVSEGRLTVHDNTGEITFAVNPETTIQAGQLLDVIGYASEWDGRISLSQVRLRKYVSNRTGNLKTSKLADWRPVYESIPEIRRLEKPELQTHPFAQLQATVIYHDPLEGDLFLYDGQETIFATPRSFLPTHFAPGTKVACFGVIDPGGFAPVIVLHKIERIGNGSLPVPKRVPYSQLVGGAMDSQWVELEGVLGSPRFIGDRLHSIPVYFGTEVAECYCRGNITREMTRSWSGQFVTLRGVAASKFDSHRQWMKLKLCVPDESCLIFSKSSTSTKIRDCLLEEIGHFDTSRFYGENVRFEAEIIYRHDEMLIVQDRNRGIEINLRVPSDVQVGDRVRVTGISRIRDEIWRIEAATLERLDSLSVSQRIAEQYVMPQDFTSEWLGTLIAIEGELVDHLTVGNQHILLLSSVQSNGVTSYTPVIFPRDNNYSSLQKITPGSHIRVTGACSRIIGNALFAFRIYGRDGNDVVVISEPDYFTPERLKFLSGMIGFLVLASGIWIWTLRRRVRKQTIKYKQQLEKEAELEARYREFINNAADVAFKLGPDGIIDWINPVGTRMTGLQVGDSFSRIVCKDSQDEYRRIIHCESAMSTECSIQSPGGVLRFEINAHPIFKDGQSFGVEAIGRDVTQRRMLEAKLRHSSRMEAIGRLAGGVAHDFNNLLTVINGNADLMRNMLQGEGAEYANEILQAGTQASSLTRQLLAFSRKDVINPRIVCPNEIVSSMRKILDRLVGERVRLHTELDEEIGTVRIDPRQLEQALLNLCVNARDAMPEGGDLYLRTRQGFGQVILEVCDTGVGMDDVTRSRIFEPFFTTKSAEEGTGIGLATVQMIVDRAQGMISVESQKGVGTTFRIYLPLCGESPDLNESESVEVNRNTSKKVILLVEDEPSVQLLQRRILEANRFEVIAASSGEEALVILDQHHGPIDMLVTDVVMPGINGRELAEATDLRRPGIPTLFLSGYTPDEVLREGVASDRANFLQKPFTPTALLAKVNEVLSKTTA